MSDGAHTAYVRAYDFTGQTTDTERITFNLSPDTPRIDRATPVVQEKPTDLPPTATATPPLILPPAPTIQLVLSGDPVRVVLPDPAVIEITARGSAELDRIELWGRYRGERGEQLLLEENAKGTTDKTITFNWNAPYAGIVEIRAHVTDNLGQEGESALLRFVLQPPPAPEPFAQTFTGTWISESPGVRFDVNFDEIGSALRGVLVEKRADGTQLTGKIVSGAVGDKTVLFAVDFAGDAQAPGHTLTFDCSYKTRPPTLTCNYATENNERGSAIFTPLAQK